MLLRGLLDLSIIWSVYPPNSYIQSPDTDINEGDNIETQK